MQSHGTRSVDQTKVLQRRHLTKDWFPSPKRKEFSLWSGFHRVNKQPPKSISVLQFSLILLGRKDVLIKDRNKLIASSQ